MNRARLMLFQLDKEGNVLSLPHNLASIIGTREWARIIITLPLDQRQKKFG